MLTSIWLEHCKGFEKLTLDTPKLEKVKKIYCPFRLHIVRGESVKKLFTIKTQYAEVKKLKNLRYLSCDQHLVIDSAFLAGLQQLKEIHLTHLTEWSKIYGLFEQKQRCGLADLKVYLCGLLLNDSDDLVHFDTLVKGAFVFLVYNQTRQANEIPLYN